MMNRQPPSIRKRPAERSFRQICRNLLHAGAAILLVLLFILEKFVDLLCTFGRSLRSRRFWLGTSLFVLAGLLIGAGFVTAWISKLDVSALSNPLPNPTAIFDRNGAKAVQMASSRMEPVSLDKIPPHLRDAVIAVEDRRFYEHKGIDIKSISRALWRDIRSQEYAEGGSTITQQLAKNLFLPTNKNDIPQTEGSGLRD